MTPVGTAYTGHTIVRPVRISGVFVVGVLRYHVIFVLRIRQGELAFAMGHPDAQLVPTQRTEHHTPVHRDGQSYELRFKLMRVVVQHVRLLRKFRINQIQFHHQLATVANTQRQRVFTGIEIVECRLGLRIVQESTGPAFGRTQHIRIGEHAAEDNHINIFQRLPSAYQVGHHDILHVESRQIERISHFALTVRSLFTDNGGLDAQRGTTVGVQPVLRQLTREILIKHHFERLHLIVLEACLGASVHTLLPVEQVGSAIPYVTQIIYAELVLRTVLCHLDEAFVRRMSQLEIAHTGIVHDFLELRLMFVGNLHHHTRILSQENLHDVMAAEFVQRDFHTAFHIRETHFEQSGNQTSGRNVMTGQNQTFVYQRLHGIESITEIFRILADRHVRTHLI